MNYLCARLAQSTQMKKIHFYGIDWAPVLTEPPIIYTTSLPPISVKSLDLSTKHGVGWGGGGDYVHTTLL